MKDPRQISHDILNILERMRIMHDLAREKAFDNIPEKELRADIQVALKELQELFDQLLQ